MNKIKSLRLSLVAIGLGLVLATGGVTGCKSVTNPTTGVVTQELDPQRTSAAIRAVIGAGVPFAIEQDPNCVPYLRLVQSTLVLAVDANAISPDQVALQLQSSSAKELRSPEAVAAVNAALGIYRAYYGDVLAAQLDQTIWLKPVLKAIIGGLGDALPPQ